MPDGELREYPEEIRQSLTPGEIEARDVTFLQDFLALEYQGRTLEKALAEKAGLLHAAKNHVSRFFDIVRRERLQDETSRACEDIRANVDKLISLAKESRWTDAQELEPLLKIFAPALSDPEFTRRTDVFKKPSANEHKTGKDRWIGAFAIMAAGIFAEAYGIEFSEARKSINSVVFSHRELFGCEGQEKKASKFVGDAIGRFQRRLENESKNDTGLRLIYRQLCNASQDFPAIHEGLPLE